MHECTIAYCILEIKGKMNKYNKKFIKITKTRKRKMYGIFEKLE